VGPQEREDRGHIGPLERTDVRHSRENIQSRTTFHGQGQDTPISAEHLAALADRVAA